MCSEIREQVSVLYPSQLYLTLNYSIGKAAYIMAGMALKCLLSLNSYLRRSEAAKALPAFFAGMSTRGESMDLIPHHTSTDQVVVASLRSKSWSRRIPPTASFTSTKRLFARLYILRMFLESAPLSVILKQNSTLVILTTSCGELL